MFHDFIEDIAEENKTVNELQSIGPSICALPKGNNTRVAL